MGTRYIKDIKGDQKSRLGMRMRRRMCIHAVRKYPEARFYKHNFLLEQEVEYV